MSDSQWPVQQAVVGVLNTALSVPVYDGVPGGATEPYVAVGEATGKPHDTKSTRGQEISLTLDAWSTQTSHQQVKDILADMRNALHRQSLSVTGADVIEVVCIEEKIELDEDSAKMHGLHRYRIRLQHQ